MKASAGQPDLPPTPQAECDQPTWALGLRGGLGQSRAAQPVQWCLWHMLPESGMDFRLPWRRADTSHWAGEVTPEKEEKIHRFSDDRSKKNMAYVQIRQDSWELDQYRVLSDRRPFILVGWVRQQTLLQWGLSFHLHRARPWDKVRNRKEKILLQEFTVEREEAENHQVITKSLGAERPRKKS